MGYSHGQPQNDPAWDMVHETTTGDYRTKYYDGSGNLLAAIPEGYNVVGTCGHCGGPIIQSMMSNGFPPPETCLHCGKVPKKAPCPTYGPVLEMQELQDR